MTGKRHSLNKAVQSTGTWTTTAPSYEFDGTDDYIDLGADAPTDLTGDITISAWINPSGWGEGGWGRVLDNNKLRIFSNLVKKNFSLSSDGSAIVSSSNDSIVLNTWQYILITRPSAGTNTNIYINGVLSGTANHDSGDPTAGDTNTFIGNNNANDKTFDGQISGMKIWNRVLSTNEIEDLYSRERGDY